MGLMGNLSDTYEILERLGEGAGGIVYKAYHKRLRQEVVLKRIKNKSISRVTNRQEVDILKKLHHSYLPQVLDFLEMGDEVYTVMSFIPGKSFGKLLKEGRRFERKELVRWGMQICSALNYLHTQNPPVIHSDIKPANIMLTPEGNICLIDFNISFYLDDTTVLGYTNGYTSPEQYIIVLERQSSRSVAGHQRLDERTDIYSVGATMYHLATGEKLENSKKKIDKELLVQCMGEPFAEVIEKATQVNPQRRYQSALEMFRAFEAIPKRDWRYRKLLQKQRGIRAGLVAFTAASILLCGYGIHERKLERVNTFNRLLKQQIAYREAGKYEEQVKVFRKAAEILPTSLESYYQNACTLYEQKEYEECISFIDYDIQKNEKLDCSQGRMADVYYLEADIYFKRENYEASVKAYEQLFRIGTQKTAYYRDYAIALAYAGDTEGAKNILQEAIECGLEEDSIFYAKGEIEKSLEQLDSAVEEFQLCIQATENDEMKMRAFLMIEEVYGEKDDAYHQREILKEAQKELPLDKQMQVQERLAQVDINLAEKESNEKYRQEAVEILNEMIEQGWGTFETYNALAVQYEKQNNLVQARKIVDQMLQMYGEDYKIYMRYAFLEIDLQQMKENAERDYTHFSIYYETAETLYKEQVRDNNTDQEMQLLENIYQQVEKGGWLE